MGVPPLFTLQQWDLLKAWLGPFHQLSNLHLDGISLSYYQHLLGHHLNPWQQAMSHLSMKIAFSVIITSAIKDGNPHGTSTIYCFSTRKRSFLWRPKFLPKVTMEFRVNQAVCLSVFFAKPHVSAEERKPHALDIRWALAFYLKRTRSVGKSHRLFLAIVERSWGQFIAL